MTSAADRQSRCLTDVFGPQAAWLKRIIGRHGVALQSCGKGGGGSPRQCTLLLRVADNTTRARSRARNRRCSLATARCCRRVQRVWPF